MHQDKAVFTHLKPIFPYLSPIFSVWTPGIQGTRPEVEGKNGKKSRKIGENGGNKGLGAPGSVQGPLIWRGLSTLAGDWIGGGANMLAMREIFHPCPEGSTAEGDPGHEECVARKKRDFWNSMETSRILRYNS